MTLGLWRRKKVLISFSSASVETRASAGSCGPTSSSSDFALSLSGSRSSVNSRLFAM